MKNPALAIFVLNAEPLASDEELTEMYFKGTNYFSSAPTKYSEREDSPIPKNSPLISSRAIGSWKRLLSLLSEA
ncbi:hypothetical protein F8M41_025813 [Gigaspora margarita]|uniref:Uncharacterized protein n=1 Tax=Gigaspora margarita TaxID=4874 RepID=A0A8H3XKF1_GIGMA|nr:hypothetical protein F8M41_025813 [Gigaspora margarita]